ncbi:MAG: 3-dehydroquinate synthase [Rhodospirillales bacterium]|nr:3-dehydroquinate synthase [Rhodospirillales bacterium]
MSEAEIHDLTTKVVTIPLGERSYEIFIGSGLLSRISDFMPFDIGGSKIFIVTDDHVERYAQQIKHQFLGQGAGFCEIIVLPHGEKTKSYEFLSKLHHWMLGHNIHRNSVVVAVGGGVIGDLTGFAAATVLRGVPFVQIPTTLLSQVDSSVGGKTGINTEYGKNLVGSFYQPGVVVADVDVLNTLPRREVLAGYAEVVKYGLIGNIRFFEWLEENGRGVCDLIPEVVAEAVEVSCKAKAAIVQEDELESGRRALLNLGHTFGHALETAAGYDGRLLHGEGVSIGMVMAFELSENLGLCSRDDMIRVEDHLGAVGLMTSPMDISPALETSVDELITIMRRDKKAQDGQMTFILAETIGRAVIKKDVPEDLVRAVLTKFLVSGGQ